MLSLFNLFKISFLLIAAFLNFGLGLFIFRKNTKSRIHWIFLFFTLGIFLWVITNALFQATSNSLFGYWLAMFAYYGGIIAASAFFCFTLVFPRTTDKISNRSLFIVAVLTLVWGVVVSWPNFTLKEVVYDASGGELITGPGLNIFGAGIFIFVLSSIIILIKKYFKVSSLEGVQIKYLLFGFGVMALFGIIFNIIFPSFNNYSFVWLGPAFSVILVISLAYAIYRHRLFDIKFILRKSTVFALILTFIATFWLAGSTFVFKYFPPFLAVFIPSLIITDSFIPLKNFLERLTEKYFFTKDYSFEAIIQAVSHNIPNTADLEVLLKNGMGYLISALKTESAAVAVLIEKDHFISRSVIGWQAEHESFTINKDSAIVQHLNHWLMEVLVRDEMDFEEGKEKEIHQKIKQELIDFKFALVAPILSKKKVIGLLFLGDKKNKDAFTVQDIQLIDVICSHLGPAIENARLFEQTKELLGEVALANKAKSDFIDIVSHQFRAPLSVIRLQAEVLQDSLKKKSALSAVPAQQSLSKIYDHTLFLINLLSEIFDVLAIEGGKLVLDKKARFLWETVDEAVKEFSMAFAQKKIDAVWEREKIAPLETEYDEMKIRNVLKILLNNALKYTKDGGVVEVKLDKKEIAGKMYFWVTVKDSGVGIHIDDIDNVFAKFFRSEDAKIMAPEGTGLGLYIAKKFIEAHGGKIWLESQLGAGTTANFILPIA